MKSPFFMCILGPDAVMRVSGRAQAAVGGAVGPATVEQRTGYQHDEWCLFSRAVGVEAGGCTF